MQGNNGPFGDVKLNSIREGSVLYAASAVGISNHSGGVAGEY